MDVPPPKNVILFHIFHQEFLTHKKTYNLQPFLHIFFLGGNKTSFTGWCLTPDKLLICLSFSRENGQQIALITKHQLVRFNIFFCFEKISTLLGGKKQTPIRDGLELAGCFSKYLSAPWRGKLGN